MTNMYFENQGNNTYLVYAIQPEDEIDSMCLGMITNNKISGLASTLFTQMDTNKFVKFNVSSKISVSQFFEGQVNKKRLLGVFGGIVNAMINAEDYMIDTSSIILDLDYIFVDVSTCETFLICLPIENLKRDVNLGAFFKKIMFSTQFDQTENCDYVAKIINYLNSTPIFPVVDFKSVLNSISSNVVNTNNQSKSTNQAVINNNKKQPVILRPTEQRVISQQPVQQLPIVESPAQQQHPKALNNIDKQSFNVPPKQQIEPSVNEVVSGEKNISLMYLMKHYNKENAALYKAQKAAKKTSKTNDRPVTSEVQKQKVQPNVSFAIPGASSSKGFAIPGQATSPFNIQQSKSVQQPQNSSFKQVQQSNLNNSPQQVFTHQTQSQGQSASFGDTTVLGGADKLGETTVLSAVSQKVQISPQLIRLKNNEKIKLNKPVFRIGKEKSYVDYFIGDNTAISRSHANIISRDGEYFIVDTNSTNHTYINGKMIQSNVEEKLTSGDKVRLANEDFEFKL